MKKALACLLALCCWSCLMAQRVKQRVVAEVRYLPQGGGKVSAHDSVRFTYSKGRHSGYDPNKEYYLGEYYFFNSTVGMLYPDYLQLDPKKVYDSTFGFGADYDSMTVYRHEASGTWNVYHVLLRSYNHDGTTRRLERIVPTASAAFGKDSAFRQDITYDSRRISKVYQQVRHGDAWDTIRVRSVSITIRNLTATSMLIGIPTMQPAIRYCWKALMWTAIRGQVCACVRLYGGIMRTITMSSRPYPAFR